VKKFLTKTMALGLLFLFAYSSAIYAEVKNYKFLTSETFMEMESIGSPRISPDGKYILFTRSWIDKMNDRSRSNLWMVDVEGSRIRELTQGNWRDFSPAWSPDGKRIAFLSDRDGTTQVQILWVDTGEVAQLTHLETPPGDMRWSPDGKKLAFTLFVPDTEDILPVKLPKKPEGAKWAEPAVVIDRLSWRNDGRGYIPKGYEQIFLVDAELGGTPKQITSGENAHYPDQQSSLLPIVPEWSSDGGKIYFSAVRKPGADYRDGDSEIYSVDLGTLQIKALTDRNGPDEDPLVSPKVKWIAYTGYDEKNCTYSLSNIYLMDTEGSQKRLLAGDLPDSPSDMAWAPDGSGVYYLVNERGESNLYFVSLDGKAEKITKGVHYLSGLSVAKNGQVATVRSTFQKPGSLVTFNLSNPGSSKELVDVNEDVLAGVRLGEVEELRFKSYDGLDLNAWLVKPSQLEANKKYPMVLYIHGGPWAMYSVQFSWDWQNFAANGYAVLYTNPRGSTGYGQDFVNGIQYSFPGKDYDDLMAAVDAAVAKGFIDENNLFVCGASGGGCLTAWIVGHTNRFKAAASMAPVIDWYSFVGTTDGIHFIRQFKKYPWEDPMEYAMRSPFYYVGNATTPTMVMTGEADLRCPISQSEEFYRALKVLKRDTVLVRMPDEYHSFRRPSHRLLRQLYLLAWFEKYRSPK
jgi:dipeptidyl aminopeptidase/acylaminoacyl peptidase